MKIWVRKHLLSLASGILVSQRKCVSYAALIWLIALCLSMPAQAQTGEDGKGILQPSFNTSSDRFSTDGDTSSGTPSSLTFSTSYVCHDDGTTEGMLFENSSCDYVSGDGDFASGVKGLFGNVICRTEGIFAEILGLLWCSVRSAIIKPLLAILTLYVTIYGVMVTLGLVQHRFSEAIMRVVRIGLIVAIATNAEVAIGIAYKFYIAAAQTTTGMMLQAFDTTYYSDQLDTIRSMGYGADPNAANPEERIYTGEHWAYNLDNAMHRIFGFIVNSSTAFIIVFFTLLIFFPLLLIVLTYLLVTLIKVFVQAVIGYLLGILGITFLFSVAPLFVCFALFRTTASWFDSWLRYLASFTIQIMIIFAFLVIMLSIDIIAFFQNVGAMMRSYSYVIQLGWIHIPIPVWSMCKVMREGGHPDIGEMLYFDVDGNPATYYTGFPRCIPEISAQPIIEGYFNGDIPQEALPPYMTPDQAMAILDEVQQGYFERGVDTILSLVPTRVGGCIGVDPAEVCKHFDIPGMDSVKSFISDKIHEWAGVLRGLDVPTITATITAEVEGVIDGLADFLSPILPPGFGFIIDTATDLLSGFITEVANRIYELVIGAQDRVLQGAQKIADDFNDSLVYNVSELAFSLDLISFLLVRMLALCVLVFLFNRQLKEVPNLANYLSGTGFTGRLGGGEGTPGLQPENFGGIDTGFQEFSKSLKSDHGPGKFGRAVMAGARGAKAARRQNSVIRSLGMSRSVRSYVGESHDIQQKKHEGLLVDNRQHAGHAHTRATTSPIRRRRSRRGR